MKFEENPDVGGGNNMFIRLKDGESIKGIPRGDNKVFYCKWNGSKSEPCEKGDEGARFRFKMNLIVNEDGEYKAKVFEQGPSVYNALKELSEDYNLEETIIKITRKGNGLETKYTVMPMPDRLSDKQVQAIAAVELNSLEPKKDVPNMAPTFDSEEEIGF